MTATATDRLRETVRFLGAVLGDVIRRQDGEALFTQIEEIRRASVAFHWKEAPSADLQARLGALGPADTVRFVHSFACFLQMANIAEDHAQRGAATVGRDDTLAATLEVLAVQGLGPAEVVACLNAALIAPVITAHPTEIRRKSVIDRVGAIADLLQQIERAGTDCVESDDLSRQLIRQVSILWRTRLLRRADLGVTDT